MGSETTDPSFADFGQEKSDRYTQYKQRYGMEKVNQKQFERTAFNLSFGIAVNNVELKQKEI